MTLRYQLPTPAQDRPRSIVVARGPGYEKKIGRQHFINSILQVYNQYRPTPSGSFKDNDPRQFIAGIIDTIESRDASIKLDRLHNAPSEVLLQELRYQSGKAASITKNGAEAYLRHIYHNLPNVEYKLLNEAFLYAAVDALRPGICKDLDLQGLIRRGELPETDEGIDPMAIFASMGVVASSDMEVESRIVRFSRALEEVKDTGRTSALDAIVFGMLDAAAPQIIDEYVDVKEVGDGQLVWTPHVRPRPTPLLRWEQYANSAKST